MTEQAGTVHPGRGWAFERTGAGNVRIVKYSSDRVGASRIVDDVLSPERWVDVVLGMLREAPEELRVQLLALQRNVPAPVERDASLIQAFDRDGGE
jgi:hypothetical protein